jgi:NADH-quinone oxidoreductase subunit J
MTETLFFYVFTPLMLFGILLMLLTRNVMHGAYGLLLVLLSVAGFFVLLHAPYLAVIQIFMYAGGIVVVLIFGIMLTNREKKGPPLTGHRSVFLGGLLGISLLALMIKALSYFVPDAEVAGAMAKQDVRQLGELFMTDYILMFEVIAVLLLTVLVGASFLAQKSSSHD